MKYTGTRAEEYELYKDARKDKLLTREAYSAVLKDLDKREKVARAAAARAAARRAAAEEKRLAELEALAAAFEAAQAAAAKAARFAARQKKLAAALKKVAKTPPEFAVGLQVIFTVRRKEEGGGLSSPFTRKYSYTFNALQTEIQTVAEKTVRDERRSLKEQSDLVIVSTRPKILSATRNPGTAKPKSQTKMKQAGALFLDGEEAHDFDSGSGRCVFDWIISRYGDVRGCKKTATLEALAAILGEHALETGVSAVMLDRVCDALRCRQYALDETNEIIHTYTPTTLNNNVPPLVYRIKNGHFYPIVKEAASISQMGRATGLAQKAKAAEKEHEEEVVEVVFLPDRGEMSKVEQMVEVCRSENLEVYGRGSVPIHYGDNGLHSFKLGGKLYLWGKDDMVKASREIVEMNGEAYTGQTIPGMLLQKINALGLTEKSTLNPHVASTLASARFRVHTGWLHEKQNGAWAADIIKCYSSLIMNPVEDWLLFDATSEWTAWDGKMMPGLYFCESEDMRMLHGSNIYSRAIVVKAKAAGISARVLYQLRPSKTLPRDYFRPLVEWVQGRCAMDWSKMKFFMNVLVGMLGKSRHTSVSARMDTDANTAWAAFNETTSAVPFLTSADGYYIYGRKYAMELAEHNLPMWIQVLDWSNMKLFDLVQRVEATGGVLVGRKTDCAVFVGGSLVENLEVGGVRICDVPEMKKTMKTAAERSLMPEICETVPWMVADVSSSSEVDAAFSALVEHGGALLTGYAGTGKTWMAKKIAERFAGDVVRVAPTNKAALNIGGRTLHKEFKIDMAGKFNLRGIRQKYSGKRVLFIVDEASMVGSRLWQMAVEVKKALPLSLWLILGDEGQCRPVQEEETDFFQGSMVRFLACSLRINLTQIQRYDMDLADLALKVRTGQAFEKRRGRVMEGRHLCYFNRTRKWLNGLLNQKRGVCVKHDGEDEQAQDAWLYAGCPVIASRNYSKGVALYCVNSEQFVVRSVSEEKLVVVSQRPEGDHVWELPTVDFHRWFCLNFASTVHKAQGDTLEGPITIWDSEAMDARILYTAITRAKKLGQISFS
jgi:hypothetical protein